MNYYEHHLGDYLRDTAHLTMVEDGAYRRLLDAYYIKELPLPKAMRDVYRLVRASTKVEKDAVSIVLSEFFSEESDGWRHKRCDTEIARYRDKQAKAKRSAEARWSASKTQSDGNANASPNAYANGMRTHSDGNALQTPDTRHHSSESKDSGGEPPPTDREIVFATGVPLITAAGVKESNARSMLAMLSKKYGESAVVEAITETARSHAGDPVSWLQTILKPKPEVLQRKADKAAPAAWEGAR